MFVNRTPNRLLQSAAAATLALFILGEVYAPLGTWTGPILCAWFIGTQKPVRGYLVLVVLDFIPELLSDWHTSSLAPVQYLAWTVVAAFAAVLPFLIYRLTSQSRQTFLATLALPFWGIAVGLFAQRCFPAGVYGSLGGARAASTLLASISAVLGPIAIAFLIYWSAAVINWMWVRQFQVRRVAIGAATFVAVWVLLLAYGYSPWAAHSTMPGGFVPKDSWVAWICTVAGLIWGAWSLSQSGRQRRDWAHRTKTVSLLRSPQSGEPLRVASDGGSEALVSEKGERYPIRNGLAEFLQPEQLTGSNRKYNRLYEAIGGMYDDIQRVTCAFRGINRDQYVMSYLRFLEVKPGDIVLETSVGTGLNYKYLPRGLQLIGLDCSAQMLANCQRNLHLWDLDADLLLGNAEDLPLANDSFDVVFHVGGINFFNDRAKAIREMIRVAKPGSRILIADETEEHVKAAYERIPISSGLFKSREHAVTAPVDLVPPEMLDVHLELLRNGRFYALTFRKPGTPSQGIAAPNARISGAALARARAAASHG